MTSGANLYATSSTHFIFYYINISAIYLSTLFLVETLTHYGKNEDYGESADWVSAKCINCNTNLPLNNIFAQKGSWVRVSSPGGAAAYEM